MVKTIVVEVERKKDVNIEIVNSEIELLNVFSSNLRVD